MDTATRSGDEEWTMFRPHFLGPPRARWAAWILKGQLIHCGSCQRVCHSSRRPQWPSHQRHLCAGRRLRGFQSHLEPASVTHEPIATGLNKINSCNGAQRLKRNSVDSANQGQRWLMCTPQTTSFTETSEPHGTERL